MPLLSTVIDPAQLMFVPGRTIATALAKFVAAKVAAWTDDNLHQSIVLLLNFAKAYNTVQRPFLLAMLSRIKFSSNFFQMISALHQNKTCRFVVIGYLLRRVNITCGIRQGCPMAPLLFILALDCAYKFFRLRSDIP